MRGNCKICGRWATLDLHHVIGACYRKKSEQYGAVMHICRECHRRVHSDGDLMRTLRGQAQKKIMQEQGWTTDDFIREFGKNYL